MGMGSRSYVLAQRLRRSRPIESEDGISSGIVPCIGPGELIMNTLSTEVSRLRKEVEDLQEDCFATALPEGVLTRVEDILARLSEISAALREANQ